MPLEQPYLREVMHTYERECCVVKGEDHSTSHPLLSSTEIRSKRHIRLDSWDDKWRTGPRDPHASRLRSPAADQLCDLPKLAPKLGQMLDVSTDLRVRERIGHPMRTNKHIPTPYIGIKFPGPLRSRVLSTFFAQLPAKNLISRKCVTCYTVTLIPNHLGFWYSA